MAKGHLSEGQTLWWLANSAEDSSFRSNDGCLHLMLKEEEEEEEDEEEKEEEEVSFSYEPKSKPREALATDNVLLQSETC